MEVKIEVRAERALPSPYSIPSYDSRGFKNLSRAIAQPEIRWVAEGKVVLHDGNVELSVIRQNSQWWLRSVSVQTDPLGKSTLARFKTSQDNSVLPPHIEGELERAFEKEKAALSAPAPQDDLAKAVRDLTERLSGLEEAIKNKT